MKRILRHWTLAIPLVLGLSIAACDDDDNAMSPGAPLVPSATETPTPAPTPPVGMTPTPSGPQTGDIIGFIGTFSSVQGSTLQVGNYTVATNDATEFARNGQPATLNDFNIGEDVRVRGHLMADGSVRAIRVAFPIS